MKKTKEEILKCHRQPWLKLTDEVETVFLEMPLLKPTNEVTVFFKSYYHTVYGV